MFLCFCQHHHQTKLTAKQPPPTKHTNDKRNNKHENAKTTSKKQGYEPVHYLERNVPLYERIAYLSAADAAVVTATRDGMNLLPYEYVVCR